MVTLHDALTYHDKGWSVIPVNYKTKAAKRKWTRFQTERQTQSDVRRFFGSHNELAIGVLAGAASGGLVVRDFDHMASYERWASNHPSLAASLPTVATGRPGRHVYMRAELDRIIEFNDGELRGNGYTLLPPSRHPTGTDYRWLIPPGDRLPFIEDLYESGLTSCNTECTENTDNPVNSGLLRRTQAVSCGSELTLEPAPEDAIQLAIVEAIPIGPGHRTRCLFELARAFKAIPWIADAHHAALKPYLKQWHKASYERIGTKPFEDSWETFVTAWGKVKYPKGKGRIDVIFQNTVVADLPLAAQEYERPEVRMLVCFVRDLQRESGDKPFFLSCRTVGKLLGVDHVTASRWLHLLCIDDILQVVDTGDLGKRQASTYRYREPL